MSEPAASPPQRWWRYLFIAGGVSVVLLLLALWYVTTQSFQAYVRRRLVSEVERITGGKAEIGSFHVVPFHMQVEIRDITVHGTESPSDVPLAHADHLVGQVKVISLLRTEFGFYAVALEHPVVHIAIASDGSTNVPSFRALRSSEESPVEKLFALSIDHLSVHNGTLLWGDRRVPLDFNVQGAGVQMDYSFLRRRYESRITVSKVDTALTDWRPFSWMTTVDLSVGATFADIKSLQWSSGRSRVTGTGRVSDFRNPRLEGNYEAHIDLEEAAAIARRHDLREGVADLKGSGRWSLEEFTTSGGLATRDLGWQDARFVLKKATASGDYSVNDQEFRISKVQGKVFGGMFTGDALVENWLHSIPLPPPGKRSPENVAVITAARPLARNGLKEKLPGVQTGTIHLRLRDVSASEVVTAVNVGTHPLGRFRPAGIASGNVDAVWKGSPELAEVTFALDMKPPERLTSGELPVSMQAQGKYHGASDALELSQLNLTTPASRVQAQGTLSQSSSLRVSVSTTNLEEWRPLVTALGGPTNLPFRVDGNATFSGAFGGTFSSPTLAGTLVAQDFEFSLPATSRTPEQQVHWDSLAASIQFSSRDLSLRGGSLRRGETTADFDLSASLQKGQFTETSPYTARVNLHHVDVASTAVLAGFDYPVTGTADLSLQIAGTRARPQVQGHIRASDASAYGESIEKFDADLRIDAGQTSLENIRLTHQEAVVTGVAAYTPESHGFRLDLRGNNFELARVHQIQLNRLPLEGQADFTLQGSGTLEAPRISAAVQVHRFIVDKELAGDLNFQAETRNGELKLTGKSEFPHGALLLEGTVAMHGDYPADFTAHIDRLDLDPLWRASLGNELTGHSSVGGTVTMRGPLRYPRQWALTGDLTDIGIELETARLHNQGPVRFTYSQQTAHIEPLHMVGEGTDVTGQGSIGFSGAQDLDLTADGQVDLKLLSTALPDFTSSGLMTIHMALGGTLSQPQPQGTIEIKNGAVSYAGLPSGLSEMN